MRYVTMQREEQVFYIEENKVMAIIEQPYIEQVPEGKQEVEGISCYKGKLVVYYKLAEGGGCSCAVILSSDREDTMTGIAGDVAGQEDKNPEELYEIINGVWGERNDKTDG